jgi:hypothetical protein
MRIMGKFLLAKLMCGRQPLVACGRRAPGDFSGRQRIAAETAAVRRFYRLHLSAA